MIVGHGFVGLKSGEGVLDMIMFGIRYERERNSQP